MLDNLWSGVLHLGVALCALAVLAGVRRKARNASLAGLGAVALAFQVLPHGCAHEAAGSASEQRWLIANVHTANQRHDALLKVVQERAPDLIGLVEVDSRWLSALDAPLAGYPHRVLHPRADNFGIALYARRPLIRAELREDFGIAPVITATAQLAGREVDLVLVHVLPPIDREYGRRRDEQLSRIGKLRPRAGHGLVIAGDLNVAPYAPTFAASFDREVFRRAGGLAGTFPAQLPAIFRIPIDHALFAGAAHVEQTIERDIHSDHMPLILSVR